MWETFFFFFPSRRSLVKCESFRCKKKGKKMENNKFGIGSRPWTRVPHLTTVSPSFLLSNNSRFLHPPDWSEISRFLLVRTVHQNPTSSKTQFFCFLFNLFFSQWVASYSNQSHLYLLIFFA